MFAYKFSLDVFPSQYDTGVRNSIALDTLRHQYNECREEVFDLLLKSVNAEHAQLHMLFELGLELFYSIKTMETEQFLSGVMQSSASYSIILPI